MRLAGQIADRRMQAALLRQRGIGKLLQGARTDTARREINDSGESRIIVGIGNQAQRASSRSPGAS